MDISKKDTKRTIFTRNERLLLSAILSEYMHIFENKKTDAVTSRLKDDTWGNVAIQFNATTTDGTQRTSLQLKTLYQNQKRESKKLVQKVFHHILSTLSIPQ